MTNSRASRGYTLLDHHIATGTESTYTFTKTLDLGTKYVEIMIIFTGKATALCNLELLINSITDYNNTYTLADSTALTHVNQNAASEVNLLLQGVLDGSDYFNGVIKLHKAGAEAISFMSDMYSSHEGHQLSGSITGAAGTVIVTSITLQTSESTWAVGTEIHIYGIRR